MAQKSKVVKDCDRDLKPTPATTTVRFAYLGQTYEIDLCEKHAGDLDREMAGWTRLAREIDGPAATFDRRAQEAWRETLTREDEHRREVAGPVVPHAALLLLRHGEDEDDADVMGTGQIPTYSEWTLTDHAIQRQHERGFDDTELMQAVIAPEKVFMSPAPGCRIHHRGRVSVVVAHAQKAVITVMFRHREDYLEFLNTKELANAR